MARARFSFRLHRTVIVLICVALLVALMQGATYFSLSHQMARSAQVEELANTLIRQVTGELAPLMAGRDDNSAPIKGGAGSLNAQQPHSRCQRVQHGRQPGGLRR